MKNAPDMLLRALRLNPVGAPAKKAEVCALCGKAIEPGELCGKVKFQPGFMDGRAVQVHGGPAIGCGACLRLVERQALNSAQWMVIAKDGAFPIGAAPSRAWFLLNPPEPPFAVIFGVSKANHMFWRVPLTLDRDHWYVQLGTRTLTVNRLLVLEAYEASKRIMSALSAASGKKKKGFNPYEDLDRQLLSTRTGTVRSDVKRFCGENGHETDLRIIESLGAGELWAINALLFGGPDAKPSEPYLLKKKSN